MQRKNYDKIRVEKSKEDNQVSSNGKLIDATHWICEESSEKLPTDQNIIISKSKPPDSPPINAPTVIKEEKFYWAERRGSEFSWDLEYAYEKIVHLRHPFFLPIGKAGNGFIREMTKLINSWIDNTAFKLIALKSLMVMPSLFFRGQQR